MPTPEIPEEWNEEEEEEEFEIEGKQIGRKTQPSEYDSTFDGEDKPLREPELKEDLVGAEDEEMERLQGELTSQQEKLAGKKVKQERKQKIKDVKREIREIKYEPLYKAGASLGKGVGVVAKGAKDAMKKYRGTPEQRAERREQTKRVIKKVTLRGKEIASRFAEDIKANKFAIGSGGTQIFEGEGSGGEQGIPSGKKESAIFKEDLFGGESSGSEGLVGGGAPGIFDEAPKPRSRAKPKSRRAIRTISQQTRPQLLAHEASDIIGFGKGSGVDLFGSGSKGDKLMGVGGGIMSGDMDFFGNKDKKKGKKSKKEELQLF